MARYALVTSILIAIFAFSNVYPRLLSPAAANPTEVRIVVHEHRLHFDNTSCLNQHLKEHLYARLIDHEFRERGYKTFSVDAVSAIDKIIISVVFWGENEGLRTIVGAAAAAIERPPSLRMVEQERGLVSYEDGLLAQMPQFGASVVSKLLTLDEKNEVEICVNEQSEVAKSMPVVWKPGRYDIYELEDSQSYTLITSSRNNSYSFPNAWDDLSAFQAEMRERSEVPAPNALFIAYQGDANLSKTADLLSSVYDSLDETKLGPNDVRPFGKAGFIIKGDEALLSNIQEVLHRTFGSSSTLQRSPGNLRLAWASLCDSSAGKGEEIGQLSNEWVAHTYFEYEFDGKVCKQASSLSYQPTNSILTSKLFYIPTVSSERSLYEGDTSVTLCSRAKSFTPENLAIASYAMRQHLRYDVGLALNIRFSRIAENCVGGTIFAPEANIQKLRDYLATFNSTERAYVSRYAVAEIIFHCSRGVENLCSKVSSRAHISEPPKFDVSFENQ